MLIQSAFAFLQLYKNPSYNQFPTTYDFDDSKQIEDFDLRTNMMAYSFYSIYGPLEVYKYFRVAFIEGEGRFQETIPTILCSDYYAEEIQAEASGASNSTFYTDNYSWKLNQTLWVCPNLNKTTVTDD